MRRLFAKLNPPLPESITVKAFILKERGCDWHPKAKEYSLPLSLIEAEINAKLRVSILHKEIEEYLVSTGQLEVTPHD